MGTRHYPTFTKRSFSVSRQYQMPLGLKPTCSMCKTNSSSMWKKGGQGEILCNNCTSKTGSGTGGPYAGSGSGGGFASTSSTLQSNGGGKQSKQEIHRRSARLRNTKYKSTPAAEKKVSTKGKGRRHIFKLKNPIKAPEAVSTIITSESLFHKDQMKIFQEKWSTWNLFVTHHQNTLNLDLHRSLPFLHDLKKAIFGLMLGLHLQYRSEKQLATAFSFFITLFLYPFSKGPLCTYSITTI
ncbi:GATA zinc finger domain-containing protein 1 isoform X2 [Ambystoma mexicanum]|uniref:GATA zinc finger domain-containing protein 1 isoform X2 n=1 Tax=Ambystoma mexicanum TaxID=8296 RepID=UPI0037E899B7